MRTCEQRGFGYLTLLFALAFGGVLLAALGQHWQVALQRERESELLFRAGEIRRALESYHAVGVDGAARWPSSLQDLLEDRRQGTARFHLRRLYADPFTGRADWLLQRDADGGIVALRSRSRRPALRRDALPVEVQRPPDDATSAVARDVAVGDWLFAATPH